MKKRIFRKLRSKAGETIAEVLIALLVSSLGLVILAQMINASANMIKNSEVKMQEYYSENNKLDKQDQSEADGTGTLKITLNGASEGEKVELTENIEYYENKTLAGIDVISYAKAKKTEGGTTP